MVLEAMERVKVSGSWINGIWSRSVVLEARDVNRGQWFLKQWTLIGVSGS